MAEEFRVAIPLNKGNLIDFRDEIEGEFKRQADNSIVFEMRFLFSLNPQLPTKNS